MTKSDTGSTAEYTIRRAAKPPRLDADWNTPDWSGADVLELTHFRPESKSRHPRVHARLMHDNAGIYGFFRVEDRYVRSVVTEYQGPVCTDSCVEFFVQPGGKGPYLNIEMNAGGALLIFHIVDSTRAPNGFKSFAPVPKEDGGRIAIFHSLPPVVDPEIQEPVAWRNAFFVPADLFLKYGGVKAPFAGQVWRGNFYKCGDRTSQPHWLSWAPVDELNFHLPRCFGRLVFAD